MTQTGSGKRARGTSYRAPSRRSFLTATAKSTVALGGLGLPMSQLMALQSGSASPPKDTAIIQIWLGGGISQHESWDPKPEASSAVRGPWGTIPTGHPGVRFCELLPLQAKMTDKFVVVRSFRHAVGDHGGGTTICATGRRAAGNPSFGSVAAKLHGANGFGVPSYVQFKPITNRNPAFQLSFNAQFLGGSYNPFEILGDPNSESFNIPDLELAQGVTTSRMAERQSLVSGLDRLARFADTSSEVASLDFFQRSALELLTSQRTREAFDLSLEDPKVRDRYGRHRWGQSALMARRLVEAGVTFVTINTAPDSILWDIHGGEAGVVGDTMQQLNGRMDQLVTALITDLYERGLDKRVLLVVWGEFGRTPIINPRAGRDHWPNVGSLLLSGGGFRMGQVLGASDDVGGEPTERPISPQDVLATMYRHLGIDPREYVYTLDDRPVPILEEGELIHELV